MQTMTLWEYAMTKLDEYRKKFPQYNDLSDGQLAYGIYNKTYRDLPLVQFAKQLGFNKTQTLDFLKVAGQKGDAVRFENQTSANVGNNPTGALRSFFQGMTFGGGDEVVAAGTAGAKSLLGQGAGSFSDMYEQELQKERSRLGQFRETNPKTAIASELVGGAVVPLGTAKNVKQGVGLGLGLGGSGAFFSADGSINDRLMAAPVGAALGAILGGTFAVAGTTIAEQIRSYISKKAQTAAAQGGKTVQQLRSEANAAYKNAAEQGVKIAPEEFAKIIDNTISEVTGSGRASRAISSSLTPKSSGVISDIKKEVTNIIKTEGDAVGFDDLQYWRGLAGDAAADFTNPAEQRVAGIIKKNIDDFVENLSEGQIYSGNSAKAVSELKKARETWKKMRKTEVVDKLLRDAQTYAGGLESGLRNQISNILRSEKKRRQFSKSELALLTQIRNGTPIGNLIGNISAAGFSLTGGRNVMGGGLASTTGVLAAAAGSQIGDPAIGAAVGLLLEQSATTGVRFVREMSLKNKVELFRNIVANNLADEVIKKNPGAYKILEASANLVESGATATTRGATAGLDQEIETLVR